MGSFHHIPNQGLRAPSSEEIAHMQHSLLSHLQLLAKQSPGHLKEFVKRMSPETYFELGEGHGKSLICITVGFTTFLVRKLWAAF